jgi:hypothetical protein
MARGQHEVGRQRRRAARLEQQQPPQLVALALEVAQLVEHRLARHVEHAADHDPARLALGVRVDAVDDPVQPHPRMIDESPTHGRSAPA